MTIYDMINSVNTSQSPKKVDKKARLNIIDAAVRPLTDMNTIDNQNKAFQSLSLYGFGYITLFDLYALSRYADILQIIFNARNTEIFRNGFDIEPLHEFTSDEQYKVLENLLKNANENGQAFVEVLQELSRDLDIFDDCYLLVLKDYYFNGNNEIVGGKVNEVLRVDPLQVEFMEDESRRIGRYPDGRKAYFKISDRTNLTDEPYCRATGRPNLRAYFKVNTNKDFMYYDNKEMLHKSAYNPSITYGYSQLFSLYNKVLILLGQDYYIKQYYTQDKPVKGLLHFNTNNWEGLSKTLNQIDAEKRRYPHKIFPVPFHSPNVSKPIEYIDMSRSLQEMQFKDTRNEIRNQIGAAYGVSPVFQNDMSTSGGLNNEGLQITITNRAIEDRQTLFNKYIIPFVTEQLGITTWSLILNPSEEQDEIHEEELEAKRIANAKSKLDLGLKGSMDEDGNFIFQEGDLELQQTQQPEFMPFQTNESADKVDVVTPVDVGKAVYQGRRVKLYKPFRINDSEKDYGVYVKSDKDNVKLLKFGSADMRNNRDDPKARKSFRARMKCDTANDKNSARYWACRLWSSTPLSEVLSDKSEVEGEKVEEKQITTDVKKEEKPIPKKEQEKFKTSLEKQLDEALKKLDFKQKPSEARIQEVVQQVTDNLSRQLKVKSANRVKSIYSKAKKKVEQQLNTKLKTTPQDKNAIDFLKKNPTFNTAINNFTDSMKSKAFNIIQNAYENPEEFTIDKITRTLRENLEEENYKLRRLARTETSKISAAARKNGYDQTGKEYKYFHIGPSDRRTSKASEELKQLTKNGVTWTEYVNLMKQVVEKYNPKWKVDESNLITHPNTRHIFIARPVEGGD